MTIPKRSWFPLTVDQPAAPAPRRRSARAREPIDPLAGSRLALAGRVVTMDDNFNVRPDAVVYVDQGRIVACPSGKPA